MDEEEKLKVLEHRLKLVQWQKLANDAALKAALVKNKKMRLEQKQSLLQMKKPHSSAAKVHRLIDQNKESVVDIQNDELDKAMENKIKSSMQRKLEVLKTLKGKMKKLEEQKHRRRVYREQKKRIEDLKRKSQAKLYKALIENGETIMEQVESNTLKDNSVSATINKIVKLERKISELGKEYERDSAILSDYQRRKGTGRSGNNYEKPSASKLKSLTYPGFIEEYQKTVKATKQRQLKTKQF